MTVNTGFRLLDVRYGTGMGVHPWIIVVRDQGVVQTWQPGQTDYDTIFRTRRIDTGDKVRVWDGGQAHLNFADGASLHLTGPIEATIIDSSTPTIDTGKVFDLRWARSQQNVLKFFGKQVRFDVKRPNGSGAARG